MMDGGSCDAGPMSDVDGGRLVFIKLWLHVLNIWEVEIETDFFAFILSDLGISTIYNRYNKANASLKTIVSSIITSDVAISLASRLFALDSIHFGTSSSSH